MADDEQIDGLRKRGLTWYLEFRHKGERHYFRIGKVSKTVALRIARVKRGDVAQSDVGIPIEDDPLTLGDARDTFLELQRTRVAAGKLSALTLTDYQNSLRRLVAFFGEDRALASIKPADPRRAKREPTDVERYQANRAAAPVRCNRELGTLRRLYNVVAPALQNPVKGVEFNKETPRERVLTVEEEGRLLAVCEEPLRTLVLVGIYSGLRLAREALTLTWGAIDLRARTLTVLRAYSKNRETRTVALHPKIVEALGRMRPDEARATDPVFLTRRGEPRALGEIKTQFRHAAKRAGLVGVSAHTLRHSFASRLAASGADVLTLKAAGGWKQISMAARYVHLNQEDVREAIERL